LDGPAGRKFKKCHFRSACKTRQKTGQVIRWAMLASIWYFTANFAAAIHHISPEITLQ
jgi:hypothetical protein